MNYIRYIETTKQGNDMYSHIENLKSKKIAELKIAFIEDTKHLSRTNLIDLIQVIEALKPPGRPQILNAMVLALPVLKARLGGVK